MKHDSLGPTLGESLNNAESWIRQAEQQWLVAEAIASKVRERGNTEASTLLGVGYLRTTTLLLALAAENSLKAVKASRGEFLVNERGLTKESRGGGSSGHSLLELAQEVRVSLSNVQEVLLGRLTEIGVWAGKYHAPLHHTAFERANAATPASLSLPNDLREVRAFVLHAAGLAGVNSVIA